MNDGSDDINNEINKKRKKLKIKKHKPMIHDIMPTL